MDKLSPMTVAAVSLLAIVGIGYIILRDNRRDRFVYSAESVPTSSEIEYIQGYPDYHLVDNSGRELVRNGDIALNPGFGVGAGMVGFGRYGTSFMA
jgi:hypothetical protein